MSIRRKIKFYLTLALLVILVAGSIVGWFYLRDGPRLEKASVQAISGDVIAEKIAEISELAVLRYHYANAANFQDHAELNGWKVPFSTKSFTLKYNGEIKLGIDAGEVRVNIDEAGKEIVITLPPVKILSHTIDESSIEVWDQTKNIFNPILIEDYAAFAVDQKKSIEAGHVDDNMKAEAMDIAEKQLGALLRNFAGIEDAYTVLFA